MAKLKRGVRFFFFSWPMVAGSIVVLWLFSQSNYGAEMYGRFNPVVTPIQVTSVEPETVNGAPGSRIRGFATIQRESCDYLGLEWELHGEARSVKATAFFADEAQIRSEGRHQWEALLVGIPPEKLQSSTGDARHQCGMFPVLTPFYRPDESVIDVAVGATALCRSGKYSTSTGPGTCSGNGGVDEWLLEDDS